jgi:hypothetical protein
MEYTKPAPPHHSSAAIYRAIRWELFPLGIAALGGAIMLLLIASGPFILVLWPLLLVVVACAGAFIGAGLGWQQLGRTRMYNAMMFGRGAVVVLMYGDFTLWSKHKGLALAPFLLASSAVLLVVTLVLPLASALALYVWETPANEDT